MANRNQGQANQEKKEVVIGEVYKMSKVIAFVVGEDEIFTDSPRWKNFVNGLIFWTTVLDRSSEVSIEQFVKENQFTKENPFAYWACQEASGPHNYWRFVKHLKGKGVMAGLYKILRNEPLFGEILKVYTPSALCHLCYRIPVGSSGGKSVVVGTMPWLPNSTNYSAPGHIIPLWGARKCALRVLHMECSPWRIYFCKVLPHLEAKGIGWTFVDERQILCGSQTNAVFG